MKRTGWVKWFNTQKGYGFINVNEHDKDIFVHYGSILEEGFKNLQEGQKVEFIETKSDKGLSAAEVVPV